MKIAVVSDHYPVFPGQASPDISYAIHQFARHWVRSEDVLLIRPWVLSGRNLRFSPMEKREFVLDGVQVVICPIVKFPFLRIFWLRGLYRILQKKFHADIVVAHLGFNLIFGYKAARKFHLPLVAAVHDGDLLRFGPSMLSIELMRRIYGYASGIACRSYPLYASFIKWSSENTEKCFVAYSGVNSDLVISKKEAISRCSNLKKNGPIRLISVCHLIDRKNIDIAIHALHALKDRTDWIYEIVGKGSAESRLQQLVKSLGVSNQVHFIGYLSQQGVQEKLLNSQIFVLVSANETFGLAYLEAMAAGNIVIAGKDTGVDGIIQDGVNGFLCVPGNVEDLANKLRHVCMELTINERKDIVKASLDTIRGYTEEKAANNYLSAIKKSFSDWEKR